MSPFAGVVLTGGQSRRMGRDKALLQVGGTAMARLVADALIGAGATTVTAVGGDIDSLVAVGLRAVNEPGQGRGPLGGIAAALGLRCTLAETPSPAETPAAVEIVAVLSCDLPLITPEAITAVVAALDADPRADVAIAVAAGRRHPLLGAWRVGALAAVEATLASGERAVSAALDRLNVAEVAVAEAAVTNVNSPEQLAELAAPAALGALGEHVGIDDADRPEAAGETVSPDF